MFLCQKVQFYAEKFCILAKSCELCSRYKERCNKTK